MIAHIELMCLRGVAALSPSKISYATRDLLSIIDPTQLPKLRY